ncbi:MAG: hypothetical protein SVK54_07560 [candidate division WOR-3 bacterium]|nr:hypothetical protein [candidate division WOR-3 bacterium]
MKIELVFILIITLVTGIAAQYRDADNDNYSRINREPPVVERPDSLSTKPLKTDDTEGISFAHQLLNFVFGAASPFVIAYISYIIWLFIGINVSFFAYMEGESIDENENCIMAGCLGTYIIGSSLLYYNYTAEFKRIRTAFTMGFFPAFITGLYLLYRKSMQMKTEFYK